MRQQWVRLGMAAMVMAFLAACGGSDGSDGAPGKDADPAITDSLQAQIDELAQAANAETCVTCHTGSNPVARTGPNHQAIYSQFYQDGVVKVVAGSMALAASGNTTTLSFKMTKNGAAFDCRKTDAFAIGSYWASYDVATGTFPSDLSLKPAASGIAWNPATNVCTFTKTFTSTGDLANVALIAANANAIVQIYGVDEILESNDEKHMSNGKYPFAGVKRIGTVNYSTAANVTGCENCHTRPFLKHAYIYGTVADNDTGAPTEFYTCKGCHYDTRTGGHVDWQILKDDPDRYAEIYNGSAITDAEKTKYAYKAKLMNDVHMSHAMEFAYPQSMQNCVTCHANKISTVIADNKFLPETCISCHAIDTLMGKMQREKTSAEGGGRITIHDNFLNAGNLKTTNCNEACHKAGGAAPQFATLHYGGYDPKIYTTAGVRYSNTFKVTIDAVSFASNKLTINFSATESPDVAGMSVDQITPTVMVGLYGYNSKDFLVQAHGRDDAGNRLLEYVVGTSNPRFTTVSAGGGKWEVTADLSMWADKMAAGEIKRAEIAVMPELRNTKNVVVGLNAPSRTFDLMAKVFDDKYFTDIVDVMKGCNTCHDQLATTFHSGIRGGNIKVCRICHEVSSGGSHLEVQSRSIDSYVHAIHSFQAFDPGDINFGDPAESVEYQHHINSEFPRFGILNCESCHTPKSAGGSTPGTPNVPDQAKSMPGVLSGSDTVEGRNIGVIPPSVTGPAVRACGACHRAQAINADDSSKLAILTQHWKTFGYHIEVADSAEATTVWQKTVAKIMSVFK
jgi:hypothetical protein